MNKSPLICSTLAVGWWLTVLILPAAMLPAVAQERTAVRTADTIAAVVNQELVTTFEVTQRMERAREEAQRSGASLPPPALLRQQVLESLIDERVILSHARASGLRVEEPELDRAVASVAAQNQISLDLLRERLRAEGIEYSRFRTNVRDQLLIERVREREVQQRIRISEADIDALLQKQSAARGGAAQLNIAQILVTVPEGAANDVVAERQARAEQALARVRGGEAFATVAVEVSEDGNKERGGEIGLRPVDRLPAVFVEHVQALGAGEVAPGLLRTGAGFHVLRLVKRRESTAFTVDQTRPRHILLRASAEVGTDAAVRRMADFRRQIESGERRFEALAAEFSEDASAAQGGDLGWVSPGAFVPEFETVMNGLPIGGLSQPVVSRFGVHLIQVVERRQVEVEARQLRQQAREALREQKFEDAYIDWVRELRAQAYIERRDEQQ
jgi:peptidyl-prolyl cis-trans isomerase SurA